MLRVCGVFVLRRVGQQQSIYTVTRCFEGKVALHPAHAFSSRSFPRVQLAEVSAGDPFLSIAPRLLGPATARAHSMRIGLTRKVARSAATTTERHRRLSTRPDP
jgi:hypothetical protein